MPQTVDMRSVNFSMPSMGTLKIFAIIIFALIVLRLTIIIVPAGHVGVVFDRGRGVLSSPMREGLNFAIPFWQQIILMDTRLQEYTMSRVADEGARLKDDSLDAPTSDGQQVSVDVTVLFKINPDKAPEIYRTIGPNFIDKLIRPFSRSQIRMVISRYTAPSIYSEKRQEAETVMTKEIAELLADKNMIIDKVLLRAVYFSADYSKAIEAKVIAEQRVKQAEFEVKEATQRAQAKIAEAQGLAQAQALQKASLTQEYLTLEALKKWDGKLPQVVGGGSVPFLNLPLK